MSHGPVFELQQIHEDFIILLHNMQISLLSQSIFTLANIPCFTNMMFFQPFFCQGTYKSPRACHCPRHYTISVQKCLTHYTNITAVFIWSFQVSAYCYKGSTGILAATDDKHTWSAWLTALRLFLWVSLEKSLAHRVMESGRDTVVALLSAVDGYLFATLKSNLKS